MARSCEVPGGSVTTPRHNQFAVVDLELHEAQARSLVRFRIGRAEKQDVVLAVAPFAVNLRYEWRQFLEVGRVTVDQYLAAIIPPGNAGFPVPLHVSLALHEQLQFGTQFLSRQAVPLEDVEEVGRSEPQLFVQQVADIAFLIDLFLPFRQDFL